MNSIWLVFRKEIREMIRDRRVIMTVLFAPIFGTFLMTSVFGIVMQAYKSNVPIAVVNAPKAPEFIEMLKQKEVKLPETFKRSRPPSSNDEDKQRELATLKLTEVSSLDEAKKLMNQRKVKLIVEIPDNFERQAKQWKPIPINVYYDPNEESSREVAMMAFQQRFAIYSATIVQQRLTMANLDPEVLQPMELKAQEVIPKKGGSSDLLVMFLPYSILLYAFFGGLTIASDLVAGEKERGTMETLLISPASRTQLVLGKFFALFLICFASGLMGIISIELSVMFKSQSAQEMFKGGIQLSPLTILLLILTLIPLNVFFAGVLVALSSFARNQREAQTYLAVVSNLVIIPAMISMFIGYTEFGRSLIVGIIPILNIATVLRQALMQQIDTGIFILTMITSVFYAFLALILAISLFRKESILFRV